MNTQYCPCRVAARSKISQHSTSKENNAHLCHHHCKLTPPPQIFRSITVGRLMTSAELRFGVRWQSCLFSEWNKHDRNILELFWRVVTFGYVTLKVCTVESHRCVKFAVIYLPLLELNCQYPIIISGTLLPGTLHGSNSNWDIRKATYTAVPSI